MEEKECGAYVITHMESGKRYIGSTSDLRARKTVHMAYLNTGTHVNQALQEAFNSDPDLEFRFYPTETREEAYDIEQLLLDRNHGKPDCLNIASNARLPWLGRKHTEETKAKMSETASQRPDLSDEEKQRLRILRVGIPHSDEVRSRMSESHKGKPSPAARPVMVNGVLYRSGLEAARMLGMPASTVKKKLNDPTNQEFVKLEKKL